MSMIELTNAEKRLAEKVDPERTARIAISSSAGGVTYFDMAQVIEFAKLMALSHVAIPKHLRGDVGACLAVTIQAIEWRLSPFSVANKSYSVNDRLSYEAQLIQAVILQRAPVKGRFRISYQGEGNDRICTVAAELREGGTVEYSSPAFGAISPKNSPLWKTDPDQQQFYYSSRALCRRHFPDVLLGIYDRDELWPEGEELRQPALPRQSLTERLDALGEKREDANAERANSERGSAIHDEADRQDEAPGESGPHRGVPEGQSQAAGARPERGDRRGPARTLPRADPG